MPKVWCLSMVCLFGYIMLHQWSSMLLYTPRYHVASTQRWYQFRPQWSSDPAVTAHPFGEAEDFHNLSLLIFLCNVSGLLPLVPLSRYPAGAGRVNLDEPWFISQCSSIFKIQWCKTKWTKDEKERDSDDNDEGRTWSSKMFWKLSRQLCFRLALLWPCFPFQHVCPLLDLAKIVSCINSCHVLPEKGYQKNSSLCHHVPYWNPHQELVSGGQDLHDLPNRQLSNANGTKSDVFLRHEEI